MDFEEQLRVLVYYHFIIDALGLTRHARHGPTHFANQLLARFIHAYHRVRRVIRQMIHLQDIFHRRDEGRTAFRRDFPIFPEMRFTFIFFKTRCTVMWETDGANSSSTALSASSRTVHRRCPEGAGEQANAISRASKAPSKMTSRGGFSRGLRTRAASSPSSTKRFFRCSMLLLVTPGAAPPRKATMPARG
jgi:hypothetical protein